MPSHVHLFTLKNIEKTVHDNKALSPAAPSVDASLAIRRPNRNGASKLRC